MRVQQIHSHVENIKVLIVEAWERRDWIALGYTSWDIYSTAEFGSAIAIPKTERADLVFHLRDHGMSLRAIESATNISKDTVARELKSGVADETPPLVTGTDGKTYSPPKRHLFEIVKPEVLDQDTKGTGSDPEPMRRIIHDLNSLAGTMEFLPAELIDPTQLEACQEAARRLGRAVIKSISKRGTTGLGAETIVPKPKYEYRVCSRRIPSAAWRREKFPTEQKARVYATSGWMLHEHEVVVERRPVGTWESI